MGKAGKLVVGLVIVDETEDHRDLWLWINKHL